MKALIGAFNQEKALLVGPSPWLYNFTDSSICGISSAGLVWAKRRSRENRDIFISVYGANINKYGRNIHLFCPGLRHRSSKLIQTPNFPFPHSYITPHTNIPGLETRDYTIHWRLMDEKLCQIKAGSSMVVVVGLVSNAVLDNVALGWWSQIYLSSLSRELIWHFANICHQVCTLLTVKCYMLYTRASNEGYLKVRKG